ncbi:MAG: twin-arginine translocation signal domain-containing protein [Gemmatimonadaceae bacterium]
MTDRLSRRDALKVLGAAGAGALVSPVSTAALPPDLTSAPQGGPPPGAEILPLTSTSEVHVPPRGRAFMKFSFDFPEPSVEFGGYRFGALVFTRENVYGLARDRLQVETTPNGVAVRCDGLVWAGGQERSSGQVTIDLRTVDGAIEASIGVQCEQPVKAVTLIVRGVPRGRISVGYDFFDPREDELLFGYPFSGGDLFGPGSAGGMTTPILMVRKSASEHFFISSLDDKVRAKRYYLQPGEASYKLEAVWETEGWKNESSVRVPPWRLGTVADPNEALRAHYAHVQRAYRLPAWDARGDVPDWLRSIALVTTLHGQHYTGYMFNDYAKMLETLRWMATEIPANRVLAFVSAWDGRYYWDYPKYEVDRRMGGEAGFRALIREGQRLGFRMMPMFGCNTANRKQPVFRQMADGATAKIDGDVMDLNWVDWDNDRHQDGWLAYMNLGVRSWREHLTRRIADMIDRFGVDAYFLDIVGGWTNNPTADMHEGTRILVEELRRRYPRVLAVGEMHYDALLEFIPFYHSGGGGLAAPLVQRHARFFQHLSHPAPGRGSSGVHEAGFGRFNQQTLSLVPTAVPTLQVVDDTFANHRETMRAIIRRARERAGIPG